MAIILNELRGLNTTTAYTLLKEGEFAGMQNVRTRPFQNLAKRQGLAPVQSFNSPVNGIHDISLDEIIIPVIHVGDTLVWYPDLRAQVNPYGAPPSQGNGVGVFLNPNPRPSSSPNDSGAVLTQKKGGGIVGAGCTYSGDFSAINHDYTGFGYSISVSAPAGCSWNVSTDNTSMIHLGLGTVHLSGGSVSFNVTENHGDTRTGNIYFRRGTGGGTLIATVVVTQSPEPVPTACTPEIDAGFHDTYQVSGGDYGALRTEPCNSQYHGNVIASWVDESGYHETSPVAYDPLTVTRTSPCFWRVGVGFARWSSQYAVPGNPYGPTYRFSNKINQYWMGLDTVNHRWYLYYVCWDGYFGPSGGDIYYKNFGATPEGTYVGVSGCQPPTLTVG